MIHDSWIAALLQGKGCKASGKTKSLDTDNLDIIQLDVRLFISHESWIAALCSARWVSSQVFAAGPLRRLLNSYVLKWIFAL